MSSGLSGAAMTAGAPGNTAGTTPVDSEQERAARLFSQSIATHEADRAAQEQRAEAATRDRRHGELLSEKETAAARLRRLRADGRPRQQMAEAEAAYRAALAALTEFETGERPRWAPPAPEEDEDEAAQPS